MKKYKRRKQPDKKHDEYPEYPWRCSCGEPGFVDLGEGAKNRFPCQKCYAEMKLDR